MHLQNLRLNKLQTVNILIRQIQHLQDYEFLHFGYQEHLRERVNGEIFVEIMPFLLHSYSIMLTISGIQLILCYKLALKQSDRSLNRYLLSLKCASLQIETRSFFNSWQQYCNSSTSTHNMFLNQHYRLVIQFSFIMISMI